MAAATKSLRSFILTASVLTSVLFFGGSYWLFTRIYRDSVRKAAVEESSLLAHMTVQTMSQIMFTGWNRQQLLDFAAATRKSMAGSRSSITLYRGEKVSALFGALAQPPEDQLVRDALSNGRISQTIQNSDLVRYVFPLKAKSHCLQCHTNAKAGEVLGVIDVRQDMAPALAAARKEFLRTLLWLSPLPFLVALLVVLRINASIGKATGTLKGRVEHISKVSDLRSLEVENASLGFREFDEIFEQVRRVAQRLRTLAVDKDLLEIEIRLMEKFIITSEVVQDWHEYLKELLREINRVMECYALFCIFKVENELFSIDIFWLGQPSEDQRDWMEERITATLRANPFFGAEVNLENNHHIADPSWNLFPTSSESTELQTKSLIVDTPKIGGIVGIGVQADQLADNTRALVMDSVLSTLLNVVGSVKAIHKYTKDLEYYATRDPLTNLYNQRVFWELLEYEIGRASRHQQVFALLVIDLDNFKSVNDTYGHHIGDQFLQKFATTLRHALRIEDIVCRYGGDEFVAILPELSASEASLATDRLLDMASEVIIEAPNGDRVKASISVGIAIYPDHADNKKELFLLADNMMYRAKAQGKNRSVQPNEADVAEAFRQIGEKSQIVLQALEQESVLPYYQPIMDIASRQILAVEVLSRIQVGENLFEAGEFIELAEKMGIIHKLDYMVMNKALAHMVESRYSGLIFFNLSPRALVLNEFLPKVKEIVDRYGIPPGRVVFEITERETIKSISMLTQFVRSLKLDGFQLAVDDFGSGFSSYHYLKHFPIDFLKIEGEFVLNVCRNETDFAFVRSIATLAKELGIRTIAEYVEDEEIMQLIQSAGVDLAQGWHIGRPQPAIDLQVPESE